MERAKVRRGLVVFDPVLNDFAKVISLCEDTDTATVKGYEVEQEHRISIPELLTYEPARVTKPTMEEVEEWMFDISNPRARCPYECEVEPDGRCPHGFKSWMLHMGLI